METQDLVQLMTQKAAAAGTVIQKISSMAEAVGYTLDLCKKKQMGTATGMGLRKKDQKLLADHCAKKQIQLLGPTLREHASLIDISLTMADYGIADTGTLMVFSDSEDLRITTMLPKIHVVVLPLSKIRKDTADIAADLDAVLKSDSASYTAFITGPSRTADIERVLAIGVHGPLELHLLLIKEGQDD